MSEIQQIMLLTNPKMPYGHKLFWIKDVKTGFNVVIRNIPYLISLN